MTVINTIKQQPEIYSQTQIILDDYLTVLDRQEVSTMTWEEYQSWVSKWKDNGSSMVTYDRPGVEIGEKVRYMEQWRSCSSEWRRSYSKAKHDFNPMLWDHIHTLYNGWKEWGDENGVEVILDVSKLSRPPKDGSYGGATVDWVIRFKTRFCEQKAAFKSLVWDTRYNRGLCLRPAGETEHYECGLSWRWDKRVKYRTIQDLEQVIRSRITEWNLPTVGGVQ